MVKVFLSHQKNDSALASQIAWRLKAVHSIDCYLDVIDPYISGPIDLLGDHIRTEMGKCSQLLAVISPATSASQWVPWEVGVGTEKNFPLATYSGQNALPPEFLRKWPYLRNDSDLDEYARLSKSAEVRLHSRQGHFGFETARRTSTNDFFNDLKRSLGQT